jgi:mRNA interferase YafQ
MLIEVLGILVNEETFPKEFKPYKLSGNYKNHVECHIEGDLLLIWLDEENDTIGLAALEHIQNSSINKKITVD